MSFNINHLIYLTIQAFLVILFSILHTSIKACTWYCIYVCVYIKHYTVVYTTIFLSTLCIYIHWDFLGLACLFIVLLYSSYICTL